MRPQHEEGERTVSGISKMCDRQEDRQVAKNLSIHDGQNKVLLSVDCCSRLASNQYYCCESVHDSSKNVGPSDKRDRFEGHPRNSPTSETSVNDDNVSLISRTKAKLSHLFRCSNFKQERGQESEAHEATIRDNSSPGANATPTQGRRDDCLDEDVDGGYAWIILACMFIINASTYGTARAYGLIFEKMARSDDQSRANAALPFTIMGALENMCGPLGGYLLSKTKSWRIIVFVGSSLITVSHLLAAYFDSLAGQIISIGIMSGVGLSFVTISSFQINNAYFVHYRSRAFGLGLTGAVVGTFYISPICQYVLDNSSINNCYLTLGLILLPNVPLSLMLKPKNRKMDDRAICPMKSKQLQTISRRLDEMKKIEKQLTVWQGLKKVLSEPMFHLIWPLQMLFCWLNFVYGMIIVDFGKDRGLDDEQATQLIPIWAFGQLAGRIGLGALVDMKFVSNRSFTVISFALISLATWSLNGLGDENYEQIILSALIFILSMFIATLYILFNNLIVIYMDESITSLSIGVSSFAGSFFLLPRANVIGYYRDTVGSYDSMLNMFAYISMAASIVWLLIPELFAWFKSRRWKYSDPSLVVRLANTNGEIKTVDDIR